MARHAVWWCSMSDETTPATERAAAVLFAAEATGLITDDVRAALAAALDVDEMARAMYAAEFSAGGWPSWSLLEPHQQVVWLQHARAIRASILGADS
jgi:hypothetical protein